MTWEGRYPRVASIERAYVTKMNISRASEAERFLYGHLSDRRIERLATNYKNRRPGSGGGEFDGAKGFGSFKVPRRRGKTAHVAE